MTLLNNIFTIEFPSIRSAGLYYFNTTSGLRYEVRFGRRQDNVLHSIIVFGVINEEFNGDEYTTTNRGEVYRVMNTIVEIIKDFMQQHLKVNTYEFTATDREAEENRFKNLLAQNISENARLKLYKRYLPKIFNHDWKVDFDVNKTTVKKIN